MFYGAASTWIRTRRMPKATKPPKPTTAELDLLRVIWRLGPSTVKDVHAARLRIGNTIGNALKNALEPQQAV